MNAKGRQIIKKYISTLKKLKDELDSMRYEEQEKLDNMPEGFQLSERAEKMEDAIDSLDDACLSLDDALDSLREIV